MRLGKSRCRVRGIVLFMTAVVTLLFLVSTAASGFEPTPAGPELDLTCAGVRRRWRSRAR